VPEHWAGEQGRSFVTTNDTAGIEALSAEQLALAPALVVLEATGGYEFEAACALQAAGLKVAVVIPRQARDFEPPPQPAHIVYPHARLLMDWLARELGSDSAAHSPEPA
jgi:hypothetical protein